MACVAAISDLHLGLGIFSEDDTHRLITLKKAIQIGAAHDLLLIASNLFDTDNPPSEELMKRTLGILGKSPVPVIINASSDEKLFANITLPENVYALTDSMTVNSKGNDYSIHCLTAKDPFELADIKRTESGIQLALVNTLFDPLGSGLTPALIRKLNLDFYFFGGSNEFRVFRYNGTIFGLFPGAAEPCTFSQTADSYAVSLFFKKNEQVTLKRYSITTVKVSRYDTDTVNTELLAKIAEENAGSNVVYICTQKPVHESFDEQIKALREKVHKLIIAGPGKENFFSNHGSTDASLRSQLIRRIYLEGNELDYDFISGTLSLFDKEPALSTEVLCDYLNA